MKRSLFVISVMIAMLVLAACAPAATPAPSAPPAIANGPALGGALPAPQDSFAQSSDTTKSTVQNSASAPTDNTTTDTTRLVIQTADLSIVVNDVNTRVQTIQDMVKAMGGFVVSVNISQTYASDGVKVPQAQIVVRVPQASLDDALTQIKKGVVDVQNETRSGQDVTDQYVDLQSRLTAKEAAADQLTKIMQDATKTQDVLAVYAQLEQIDSDIEVLKGQIKYTEQSAALSSISVNIIAAETIQPIVVAGWKPQGVARDALRDLISFWQGFIDFLIRFFLYVLPLLITIGIPIFLVILLLRWIFRITRKPRPEQSEDIKK